MNKPEREGFVGVGEPIDDSVLGGTVVNDQPEASPEPPVEEYKEVWPIKVRLIYKPIRNNKGELVHELAFRQPTGADINRNGLPVRIDYRWRSGDG